MEHQEQNMCNAYCGCSVTESSPNLCVPMDYTPRQSSLPMGFPRREYWSGLPFPSPGDLPRPGINLTSLALAGGFFTTEPPSKPFVMPIAQS